MERGTFDCRKMQRSGVVQYDKSSKQYHQTIIRLSGTASRQNTPNIMMGATQCRLHGTRLKGQVISPVFRCCIDFTPRRRRRRWRRPCRRLFSPTNRDHARLLLLRHCRHCLQRTHNDTTAATAVPRCGFAVLRRGQEWPRPT